MLAAELDIHIDETFYWSDSKTTLAYIQNAEKRFHVFVANRIAEIRDNTSPSQWHHCPGLLNPADDASRGLMPQEFHSDHRWLKGPSFLWKSRSQWPDDVIPSVGEEELELKAVSNALQTTTDDDVTIDRLLTRYSSWSRLTRAVAFLQRFVEFKVANNRRNEKQLTVDDIQKAEAAIVRCIQRKTYQAEADALERGKDLSKQSKILKLTPFIDETGLIRAGGRLEHADMAPAQKHPIILPRNHPASTAIVNDAHAKLAHSGVEAVVAEIRGRFWIPQLRALVKQRVRSCVICRRLAAKRSHQLMSSLPAARTTGNYPFEATGVDFFGPFYVKIRRSTEKRWGCLFTCMATRAVHLELTRSLDTDHFINVLRRFRCRRGNPKKIHSDNGTNFVGAERELRQSIDTWNHNNIASELQQTQTEWLFNTPAAPHTGGAWERLVRSVKRCLKVVLNGRTVTPEVLETIFVETEAIINARPITRSSDDPSDLSALTPNNFLMLRCPPSLSPGVFTPLDELMRKQWRQVQALVDRVWTRWRREYLPTLMERTKWTMNQRNYNPGDLVLLVEDNAPRGHWPLAVITDVFPGPDGLIRTVKLKTKSSMLIRPVTKLCLLEGTLLVKD
ncbi:MAG: hypothetical protein AAF438_14300 [Pseudomonadota bacterium]